MMCAVTHLAGALIFAIGDFILQLVREDIPDVQLVAIFKQGGEWVSHIQGGLLFVFTYIQLEVGFSYFSCGGGTGGSSVVYWQTRAYLHVSLNIKCCPETFGNDSLMMFEASLGNNFGVHLCFLLNHLLMFLDLLNFFSVMSPSQSSTFTW